MSNENLTNVKKSDANELLSLVNTEQYDKLEEAWQGVVESDNQNLSLLFEVVDLLVKREERRRAHDFLMTLSSYYKQKGLYLNVLEVLKKVLGYNPREKTLAKEISECYSNIYKDRPYGRMLVEKTGIETATDITHAMKKLEKYFYLDTGDYVFHKSWGVGQVVSVDAESEKVNINFEKKSNHSIAMDIAPEILQRLDNDDLLVMIYAQKDVLNKMVKEDPVALVKLTLKFFKGKALVSTIKNRLTTGVMPVETWSRWWTNTKKLVKKDPYIRYTEGTPSTSLLELRAAPMSHHQEILGKLNHIKDIDKKIEISKKYISEMKDADFCRDTLTEIANLFIKEADALCGINTAQEVESLLLLEEIQNHLREEVGKYKSRVETLIQTGKNLPDLIDKMTILEYKKLLLSMAKKVKPDLWHGDYMALFFTDNSNLWEFIIKDLISEQKQVALEELSHKVFNQFNAYPEHYIWFCKNGMQERYPELYKNIDPAIMFNRLIELLDNMHFKILKGREGDFKAIVNKIENLLADKGSEYALRIVNDANAESIYNVVSGSKGLEDWFKVAVESVITDRFPDLFEKLGAPELDETKIYSTRAGYEKRKKEFDHLMNIEFAENARDLGEAISRGDLRENAEYKAAREKQAMLVEKAERMKAELQKAVVIEPYSIEADTVSPGTKVTLKNLDKEEAEIYTLLGPWDVDIEKGIISYMSPVGRGLMHKAVGNVVKVKLPDGESMYKIMKIEKALQ
ncbi:MAG: transcription elongation factor GreA [Candidatus Brocadiaceae bacterium]